MHHSLDAGEVFGAILPKILAHARFAFRFVRCPQTRDDKIQETLALCWKWTLALAARGKDVRDFPTTLASFASRAVRSGRTVCGSRRPKDVLSPVAQATNGFVCGTLPDYATLSANPLQEALCDNTVSPVDEQVAFRIDFPAWRGTYCDRDRRLINQMMVGERTHSLASRFKISPARISQRRREFCEDWMHFTAEET